MQRSLRRFLVNWNAGQDSGLRTQEHPCCPDDTPRPDRPVPDRSITVDSNSG